MKLLIQLEELAMFLIAIYFFNGLPFPGWLFAALILAPDLSMLGYLINAKVGAYLYNFVHHKGMAIICWAAGMYLHHPVLQLSGIILFAHSSMDRFFGYGLKHTDAFTNTHLGRIGKK